MSVHSEILEIGGRRRSKTGRSMAVGSPEERVLMLLDIIAWGQMIQLVAILGIRGYYLVGIARLLRG